MPWTRIGIYLLLMTNIMNENAYVLDDIVSQICHYIVKESAYSYISSQEKCPLTPLTCDTTGFSIPCLSSLEARDPSWLSYAYELFKQSHGADLM